jgi:hypothetical protein
MTKTYTEPVSKTVEAPAAAEVVETIVNESETIIHTTIEQAANASTGLSAAIREGADDARQAVTNFFPAVQRVLHKGVYRSFYVLSYGAVFGALTVGRLIPSNNAMGEGVHDGFAAAKKDFADRKANAAESAVLDKGLVAA